MFAMYFVSLVFKGFDVYTYVGVSVCALHRVELRLTCQHFLCEPSMALMEQMLVRYLIYSRHKEASDSPHKAAAGCYTSVFRDNRR